LKIYIKIYIKTAPTCFGVTVTPSSGSALIRSVVQLTVSWPAGQQTVNWTTQHVPIAVYI